MQYAIGEVLAVNDRRRIAHEAPVSGDPRALPESLSRQCTSLAQCER